MLYYGHTVAISPMRGWASSLNQNVHTRVGISRMKFAFDFSENRLIAGARAGRPPSYLRPFLYVLSLQGLILILSGVLGGVIASVWMASHWRAGVEINPAAIQQELTATFTTGLWAMVLSLPQLALLIGWTWLWVTKIERRPFRTIGLTTGRASSAWLRGMAIGAGLFLLSALLLVPGGNLHWVGFALDGLGPALLWSGIGLLFFLIQGPAEEIMARGYLLPAFGARGGAWVGILLSSLIFTLFHALNPNLSVLAVLNLFLYGILTALYALREQGLWGVFGLHTAWNWMQGNVLGLPVSGAQLGVSPLFRFSTGGPAWWSGGPFGPEGGLVVTIPTLIAIGILLFWKYPRADTRLVSDLES